eukprot:5855589-Pleurochrysis_carterae.AAC.1
MLGTFEYGKKLAAAVGGNIDNREGARQPLFDAFLHHHDLFGVCFVGPGRPIWVRFRPQTARPQHLSPPPCWLQLDCPAAPRLERASPSLSLRPRLEHQAARRWDPASPRRPRLGPGLEAAAGCSAVGSGISTSMDTANASGSTARGAGGSVFAATAGASGSTAV